MTPGSFLLGNADAHFECGHEHGEGDRCISFHYDGNYFKRIAADVGMRDDDARFRLLRLPPLKETSRLVSQTCSALEGGPAPSWEELGLQIAAAILRLAHRHPRNSHEEPPSVLARVTRAVRRIERDIHKELTLATLAKEAGLTPYHFLRTFTRLTELTPHQYVRRARLREAAIRLSGQPKRVLDIALDTGFGDVSNFNRAFRGEFGISPLRYRRQLHQK